MKKKSSGFFYTKKSLFPSNATLMDQQLADLSQLLGAMEAQKRMADIIVDRMAASYSAHCDSNEAFVYR